MTEACTKSSFAVLDLTHAGLIIARKLAAQGHSVTAVDVYGTVPSEVLHSFEHEQGLTFSRVPVPVEPFEHIISPVHLDPAYPMLVDARAKNKHIISHHQAVGMILAQSGALNGSKIIEISGSKAKTSTASLLADMISWSMPVALHTTRGLELWNKGQAKILHLGLSIAPGSILHAVDILCEGEVPKCCIFEVSIGTTGHADINVITTLEPDYGIAKNTAMASDAKLRILEHAKDGSVLFLNSKDTRAISKAMEKDREFYTFTGPSMDEMPDMQHMSYNVASYGLAFAASRSIALYLEVAQEDIERTIANFKGLQGRMQEKREDGRTIIDNSNSGLDIISAEKALDYGLLRHGSSGKVIMVLGEEAAQVCEGLPPENVADLSKRRIDDIHHLILIGNRMRNIMHEKIAHADNMEQGLGMAMQVSMKGDIVISCVKCFR